MRSAVRKGRLVPFVDIRGTYPISKRKVGVANPMTNSVCPDVLVYVCHNCVPHGAKVPRQWKQDDVHVRVQEIPCSGKIDIQYLFHALEGGGRGVCVVACPKGECRLAQGNYRAEVRTHTVQRLLSEIGIEPDRVRLLECSPEDAPEKLENEIRSAVSRFAELGDSPLLRAE